MLPVPSPALPIHKTQDNSTSPAEKSGPVKEERKNTDPATRARRRPTQEAASAPPKTPRLAPLPSTFASRHSRAWWTRGRISGPPGLLCEPRLGSAAVSPEVLASDGVTEDRHTVLAGSAPDHCQAAPGSRPSGAVTRNLPQWLLRPGLPGIPTGSCL